jgi:hexosaminidase
MARAKPFVWTAKETPKELHAPLKALAGAYPLCTSGTGRPLRFRKDAAPGTVRLAQEGGEVVIHYSERNLALRALGSALAGLAPKGKPLTESTSFTTFGFMLDCSRNAVMRVEHLQEWLRRLALLGYNMVMLYTEDTYELSGEPMFGFMRGGYTKKELREIERYASALGIELIPCIQTLGHLSKILL